MLLSSIAHYQIKIYNKVVNDIYDISKKYIDRQIIPSSKQEDGLHLAFATYYEFDILLSWNFKHLANIKKQGLVNSVNCELGYRKPLIMTNPMEVIYEK
jgi:hypothetical protein